MSDGNGGANYAVTFVNDTTGEITARAITVTATTDTKGYDATTSSAAVPTITVGTLAGTDTGSFTQTFDTANVGTAKTLTPAGSVSRRQRRRQLRHHLRQRHHRCDHRPCDHGDRNHRHQGLRRAPPARRRSRPSPSATLAGTDTGAFTQTFDTASAGTGKTLTPAGSVLDGNGGANYAITFVTDTTGVITGRAITVTADSGQPRSTAPPTRRSPTPPPAPSQPGDSFTGSLGPCRGRERRHARRSPKAP